MKHYFLGVDVGGTKCHAVVVDETGQVIGFGTGGTGNHETVGYDGFANVLKNVTDQALRGAGIEQNHLTAVGMGIAGLDWPDDEPLHRQVIRQCGFDSPTGLVNDAVIGLIAGSRNGWGISLVSGTGSNCRGRDKTGREGRVSGIGTWSGEYGGGGDLVRVAMHSVSKAWSMRGPDTILAQKFASYVGAKDVMDLLEGLSRGRYDLNSSAAILVFEAAEEQDEVAIGAIRWLGTELGNLATGVIHQLSFHQLEFDLVLTGSIYKGNPLVALTVADEVHKVAPRAILRRLAAPPVVGAVMLAMEQVRINALPLKQHIVASTNHVLGSTYDPNED